jgi:hypothetical protein
MAETVVRQFLSLDILMGNAVQHILDKVNSEHLRQNLAAGVTLVYLTANRPVVFGPVERSE